MGEEERIRLVLDRFRENGLDDPEVDDFGNASGILLTARGTILHFSYGSCRLRFQPEPHVINVGSDHITGPGIADNAIGMAAVVGLPKLLDRLGIKLKDDLSSDQCQKLGSGQP